MPYVEVWVDATDLDDYSDEELREELAGRTKRKNPGAANAADYTIPKTVARYTLEEASDILRQQGKTALAYKLDEVRADFIGH